MTQLRPRFDFAVYGASAGRVNVSASGLEKERVPGMHAMSFYIWFEIPEQVGSLRAGLTQAYFEGGPRYWDASQHGGPTLSLALEQLFVLFVHGAASGWNVVERRTPDQGAGHDEIRVDKRHHPDDPRELGRNLILSKKRMRKLCKADLLAFYVHFYEEKGALAHATRQELKDSSVWRFPYSDELIDDLHKEAVYEGFLDGPFGQDRLKYEKKDSVAALIEDSILEMRSELVEIGARESWGDTPKRELVGATGVTSMPTGEPRVFVIHGHDEARRYELVEILQDKLKLEVVVMKDKPGKSRAFIEKFEQEAATCNAAIAILTPDDVVQGDGETYRQPRPNVVYELGWFAGRCGRHRTLMVVKEGTSVPSDWLGIEQLRFRKSVEEVFLKLEREVGEWRGAVPESG